MFLDYIKSMTYSYKPSCFPDYKLYREWVYLTKVSKEVVSPCDDCTSSYEMEMKNLGLCQKVWVIKNLQIGGRSKVLTQGVLE